MAKTSDSTEDPFERRWNRELVVVAVIVALVIAVGAVWTLLRGPQPTEGAGGTVAGVPATTTESGALRPANTER